MSFSPVRADEGEFKEIEFLWYPFIQKDNLNMLTGDPGAGKSTIICELAARLSTATPMPGEAPNETKERGPLNTLILNAEDGFEDTIKWRLRNQQADMTRVWVETTGQQIDAALIKEIYNFVRAKNIALLVVDPLQAWIGADADLYRANHTRAWTNQFRELPCTTLFCRHMRKSSGDDTTSMYAGLGSIDLTGAVRSEIRASVNRQTGSRSIERIKGNVGPMMKVEYQIVDTEDPRNKHGQLQWSKEKPAAVVGAKPNEVKKLSNDRFCLQEIEQILVHGPLRWEELRAKLRHDHGAVSLTRAKRALFHMDATINPMVRLKLKDEQRTNDDQATADDAN